MQSFALLREFGAVFLFLSHGTDVLSIVWPHHCSSNRTGGGWGAVGERSERRRKYGNHKECTQAPIGLGCVDAELVGPEPVLGRALRSGQANLEAVPLARSASTG